MAKVAGRTALIKKATVVIGGVRVTNVTMDAAPIDITDNDSAGFTELLNDAFATRTLGFSVEGLEEDQVLRDLAMGTSSNLLLSDLTFTFGNGDILSGSFYMTNYTEGNPYQEASTFTAAFTSSGAWTYA